MHVRRLHSPCFFQVEHVIQFDFPQFISDYIHRAGRVGRIGARQPGRVSSFVIRPSEISLAQKIEVGRRVSTASVSSLAVSRGHGSAEQEASGRE